MNKTLTGILYALGAVLIIVTILFGLVPISYNNTAADQEVAIVTIKDNCMAQRSEGIKAIAQEAFVDTDTKQFIVKMIDSASPEQTVALNGAYQSFVNGNTQPFMLMMSALSGTDVTMTAQNVQREISSQRSAMMACAGTLNGAKQALKKTLGMDASGRVVKFPQTLLHLDYPSLVTDLTLTDTDNDGRITVLDYSAPVTIETKEDYGTGISTENTNPYSTP